MADLSALIERVEALTDKDLRRLDRIVKEPFYVYSPSVGGGRANANLIRAGLIEIRDVSDDHQTILFVSATDAGRRALQAKGGE